MLQFRVLSSADPRPIMDTMNTNTFTLNKKNTHVTVKLQCTSARDANDKKLQCILHSSVVTYAREENGYRIDVYLRNLAEILSRFAWTRITLKSIGRCARSVLRNSCVEVLN